jgi:hypothetical protein
MTFLNKNHFLPLACALLLSNIFILCRPSTSPTSGYELFRKEFAQVRSVKEIAQVVEQYHDQLKEVNGDLVFWFLEEGYILRSLNTKKQLLERDALNLDMQDRSQLKKEVEYLQEQYDDLQKVYTILQRKPQGYFGRLSYPFSVTLYRELLFAIEALSLPGVKFLIEQYRLKLHMKQLPTDKLNTTIDLTKKTIEWLIQLQQSDSVGHSETIKELETILSALQKVKPHLMYDDWDNLEIDQVKEILPHLWSQYDSIRGSRYPRSGDQPDTFEAELPADLRAIINSLRT